MLRGVTPHVSGFTIEAAIGAGGFSEAWAAVRDCDGIPVVLKVGRSNAPVLLERFRREAEAMERVGFPYVPRFYDSGQLTGGQPYLIMERLFGVTLGDWLARQNEPPPIHVAQHKASRLLTALAAAHARGVIHRDLKPENIFETKSDERIVLLDFGLTRRLDGEDATLTRSGVAVGTPEYMAPEQLRGSTDIGVPADIYAIGVILYELLTRRRPFVGTLSEIEHGHLTLRPPRPSAFAAIPVGLEELVLSCLAKQPERRPTSALEVQRALAKACAEPMPVSRSGAVAQGGAKLIGQGKQPVVLLAVESEGDAALVLEEVSRRGGMVARQRGKRFLSVFSGQDMEDPARAALGAAEELVRSPGVRAVLHVENVLLRRNDRGTRSVYGAAVDRPESWMPSEPFQGVVRTAAFELGLSDPTPGADASSVVGEHASDARRIVPLVGREAELGALAKSLRVSFEERRATLCTLIAENGFGKTRLAAEIAEMARSLSPESLVVSLFAQANTGASGSSLVDEEFLRAFGKANDRSLSQANRRRTISEALEKRAHTGPVAVILDDAQWAEGDVLDALEFATLDGATIPLWVMVAAHPRFEQTRPSWGARTRHHERIVLEPLEETATKQLAAELLKPAEYPPDAVLVRLAQWSGGNPFSLSEIVRALKRAGIVRQRSGTNSYYVATADFDALPPSPAWQWMATRRLALLPPELASCVRLCSVLGVSFLRDEVEWVERSLEREGLSGTPVDIELGLGALEAEGLLARGAKERYSFRSMPFQDAVYELLEPAQRKAVHRCAFAYWQSRAAVDATSEALESLARHAVASGEREAAVEAYLRLGDDAFSRHRHVDGDRYSTAALGLLGEEDARWRAAALGGRGRCRYRFGRAREAQEDLIEARKLAEALGDRASVAEYLLEEATALDWLLEFGASAERMEEARPIVEALEDPRLALKLRVAEGRTLWRRRDHATSIELLSSVCTEAAALEEYESRVVALVMILFQLVNVERHEEALARFDELHALTTRSGDRLHLASAYGNRSWLWRHRGEMERAESDLQQTIELAREMGDPNLEWIAAMNLGEALYSAGRNEDAMTVAARAVLLEERFRDRPEQFAKILLAQVLCATDRYEEAENVLEAIGVSRGWRPIETTDWSQDFMATVRMLRLILSERDEEGVGPLSAEWDALLDDVGRTAPSVLPEVFYWRARMEIQGMRMEEAGHTLRRARDVHCKDAQWAERLEELEDRYLRLTTREDERSRAGV